MNWLKNIVDELVVKHGEKEIIISSGVSPSGTYHLGTLREVLTAEAIYRELKIRGHAAKHIHVVDDLDIFRKVPVDVDEKFSKYLGLPLCDVPSPDISVADNYADFFLSDLLSASEGLHLEMEIVRAHVKYRNGEFVESIETALSSIPIIRNILEEVSGRKLDPSWSPVQVIEDGRLKNRKFISIDKQNKTVRYLDSDGNEKEASYSDGSVKLNWRIDWPARWSMLGVKAEPFGKDHATKGGSYDTGVEIVKDVYGSEAPLPIPYNFINKTGDTKKMSKSAGDTITAADLLKILPPELVWFFILRYSPDKLLFFDTSETLIKLFDEFSELLAKPDKSEQEEHLIKLCLTGVDLPTVSRVPFTHLYVSYQSSLKNIDNTIEVIERTEYAKQVSEDRDIVSRELSFIDSWLENWAEEDVKFNLLDIVRTDFTEKQKEFMVQLADIIEKAPNNADGEWFHKAIYSFKDKTDIEPKLLFETLYEVLIGKKYGPRAGWFLSMLPREWLISRLRLIK